MKKVLITGGAGFIGSALIRDFEKLDFEIFVIDNLSFGNRDFINIPDNHFYKEDIRDGERMKSIVAKINPQWIIHLAAVHFIPYCNEHPFESGDVNIRGTMNILDAAKGAPNLEKMFFASTAAVYPISDVAVSESHPLHPLDIYGLAKLTGERLLNEFYLESGIPTIICRFFNAFGPNETNPHLIPEIQQQINDGVRVLKLGNTQPKRDFIHTYDMSRAVTMLMNKIENGIEVFNLGRGIEYSVVEIVEAFARQLNEEVNIEVDPAKVRATDRMHLLADVSKLKAYTGWEPEWGIDEGIKTMIKDA